MLKVLMMLVVLSLCGCASQPVDPASSEKLIHFFYEAPNTDFEVVRDLNMTRLAGSPEDALNHIRDRAAALGADGVIVYSIRGGAVGGGEPYYDPAPGNNTYGYKAYRIRATAIRYPD